ncbi:hypothetical protein PFISCL1PPCAC_14352, partial [Pristionchus fissidentatus]
RDEQAESLDVHGAVHFKWIDPHCQWNGTKFHNISAISRTTEEFYSHKPWTPRPFFHNASIELGRDIPEPDEVEFVQKIENEKLSYLTIFNDGSMILSVPFFLRVPCNFDFLSFPYDEQICSISVR